MKEFHKEKSSDTDYFNSITTMQLSLSNYIQSLSRLIVALEKKNMDISSHTLIETKHWIISALSNVTEIQKILLKKTKIYFLYIKLSPHDKKDMNINLESYIHFDQKMQRILSTPFFSQDIEESSDSYKHIRNMTMFHSKKEWAYYSRIMKKGQDPASPWIADDCKPKM